MRFKSDVLEMEYAALHPQTKELLTELDTWSLGIGYPEIVITEILRTAADQERLYWEEEMHRLSLTEAKARESARKKPSWHLWATAVDLRVIHYSEQQKAAVINKIRELQTKLNRKFGAWELYYKPHGTGPHLHVSRKDLIWKEQYTQKVNKPLTIKAGITTHEQEPSA